MKFAFLVHDPCMLVHYEDVWKALDPLIFTIVLTEYFSFDGYGAERPGQHEFMHQVQAAGYNVANIIDVISCGLRYEYVVTNHPISGSSKEAREESAAESLVKKSNLDRWLQGLPLARKFEVDTVTFLPLQIGHKQIRYMYGADISDSWSLASWNSIYDIFLCHGVNDEREINKRFAGIVHIMGYPRYDRFFDRTIDYSAVRSEFHISDLKKTVLWMPTLGNDDSSIPHFANALSSLKDKFNFIVRPHPLSFVQDLTFIALLEEHRYIIDRNALRDMNKLFGIADVVLTDSGGTPFSSIFLGKNVVLLDVPSSLEINSENSTSSSAELRQFLPVIDHKDIGKLECLLCSEEFFEENSRVIAMLFKKYFDSPRGGGAKRVVDIFVSL